jgi:hypothetical protein
MKILLLTFGVAYVGLLQLIQGSQGLKYEVELSSNYSLKWEVVNNETVDFFVRARTPGWVGLALNYRPRMNGADMVIGGVDDETKSNYLYSFRGHGNTLTPTKPSHWRQGSQIFVQSEGETLVSFRRALNTGEVDGITIENKDLYLLWAYGADDNVRKKHVANGAFLLNLISPEIKQ